MFTHYDALHIKEDASPEVIRAAYKALAQKWHPDKHTGTKEHAELRFKAISSAYEILSDPDLRASYDAELRAGRWKAEEQPEPARDPASRTEKASIPSLLWSGKVPLWKLIWIYMIGLPLAFIFIELAFARENGGFTAIAATMVVIAYMIFIHLCLWRAVRAPGAIGWTRVAKGYCLLMMASPALLAVAAVSGFAYDKWKSGHAEVDAQRNLPATRPASAVANNEFLENMANTKAELDAFAVELKRQQDEAERREKDGFDKAVLSAYKKYPFFNKDSTQANPLAINELIQEIKEHMVMGANAGDVVREAVDKVAPKYSKH